MPSETGRYPWTCLWKERLTIGVETTTSRERTERGYGTVLKDGLLSVGSSFGIGEKGIRTQRDL